VVCVILNSSSQAEVHVSSGLTMGASSSSLSCTTHIRNSRMEIDNLEAVNVMPNNQMALHTTLPVSEMGVAGDGDYSRMYRHGE
jgi:hypothetical protein